MSLSKDKEVKRKMKSAIRGTRTIHIAIPAVIALFVLTLIVVPMMGSTKTKTVQFNPKSYKGQMGKISTSFKGESLLRVRDKSDGTEYVLKSTNGVFQAPVGSYEVSSYEATAKDKAKAEWTAHSTSIASKVKSVTLKANTTCQLKIGPPLTASAKATTKSNNQASLSFSLVDDSGSSFLISKDSGQTNPPGFKVLSKSGDVLWQGSFKYG